MRPSSRRARIASNTGCGSPRAARGRRRTRPASRALAPSARRRGRIARRRPPRPRARRTSRQQIVRGEHERCLRSGSTRSTRARRATGNAARPRPSRRSSAHLLRMLECAHREAQSTAVDAARARVGGLLEPVAVGRDGAEAKRRRDEAPRSRRPRECRRELVVVRWSEGRWIGEHDCIGPTMPGDDRAVRLVVRSWGMIFHGNADPPRRRGSYGGW